MANIQYMNEAGKWVDYKEQKSGISIMKNGEWVDGASNEVAPPVAVSVYDGAKFVQVYPTNSVTYQKKFVASGMKYTYKSSSNWGTSSPLSAIGGIWTTNPYYGWLGLTSTNFAHKDKVEEIVSISATYKRRGVGNWELPYPIALTGSTLTSATGSGSTASSSRRGVTIFSDTKMAVCSGTNATASGTTTFNSNNAKTIMRRWLNGEYNSLLLGYMSDAKADAPYISLYGLELTVTYKCTVLEATFKVDEVETLSAKYKRKKEYKMWIYEDEVGLNYDEIMEKRDIEGLPPITGSEVR